MDEYAKGRFGETGKLDDPIIDAYYFVPHGSDKVEMYIPDGQNQYIRLCVSRDCLLNIAKDSLSIFPSENPDAPWIE
jgi:hypothetical protein